MTEVVYDSRGKLIGGSLSRERKVKSRPSEKEGGDNRLPVTYLKTQTRLPVYADMSKLCDEEA